MPQALTNTNISATYKGVLHTNGTAIPPTGQEIVSDGTGVISALSVGRLNQGATVSGALSATDVIAGELTMPNTNGALGQVVALTSSGVLGLKSLSELITGTVLTDDVYYNPKITVEGGVITKLESRPTVSLFNEQVQILFWSSPDVTQIIGVEDDAVATDYLVPAASNNINWYSISSTIGTDVFPNMPEGVKYAIVSTDISAQSNGSDYRLTYSIDGLVVARAEVREHWQYKGVDTMINTNQQFIKIPVNKISSTSFKITKLNGCTAARAGVGSLNIASLKVSVVGWIY